eukprot:TRINITY_DN324_c1_g1_i10.p1 TRINITY_DN324_c1_g1~~TRINITY_DN324_c1_g1_i10.p1  ORF type:complete len:1548 (+),score=467.44 TRINITY_DN324_c1_g1_i10:437-5080(+)
METVLRPPLEQLVKKASGKKHIALRQACADVLEVLSGDMGKVDETGCANAVVRPLLMGLETDNTRIVRVALEGIHSLISEGYLASFPMEDDFHGEEESELLSDRVIQLVCACFSIRDDVVENLVLKILMAAMISETFSLHGGSLLGAVRTCYNVHLVSKNVDNQIFAKAVILQTVRIVLARLDMQYKADHPELQKESENESTDESGKEVYEEEEENPIAEPGDAAKSPPPPKSFLTSEAEIEKVVNEEHEESHEEFANILERDVFLLFRAFCKLSMKKITEDEGPDGMALRCRILSLEMLLFGLNDPQDSLTRSSTFSILIKKYLCISLLKNSVSTVPAIFRLSVSVLLSAMSSFRSLLKEEISIFFTSVFLRILQSAHSPFTHKIIAIHALHEICRNPQALVELFVNFDCDVHEVNIYERMINALCKVVGSTQTEVSSFNDQQRMILRLTAMHCLVTVLRSSREWMDSRLGLASVKKEMDDETVDDDDDDDDESIMRTNSTQTMSMVERPDVFEKKKQEKIILEKATSKFNLKPKRGIQFLISHGLFDESPESIANFLLTTPNLDKTMIGEYLGEGEQFNISVLYAYVDKMSFGGMDFDEALRNFLSGFRLPGEAQKIDRMMEKFAERFCADNPHMFASADTAYVLAYSTIMLQTDAHNPMVKNKMTKEGFISNNRGIDDGADLPRVFLEALYDRIVQQAISLEEDEDLEIAARAAGASDKKMHQLLIEEGERIYRRSHAMIQSRSRHRKTYYCVTHAEHVKSMFEISCWSLLAVFSVEIEFSEVEEMIALCLEGFQHAIHISAFFDLETERDAYVQSLFKFTLLTSVAPLKKKNVDCVKTLLEIGASEGNVLKSSWKEILLCASELHRLGLVLRGSQMFRGRPEQQQMIAHDAHMIGSSINLLVVDKLFSQSSVLDGDAIVAFVEKLCEVSLGEIEAGFHMFSLQKLIEVASYNMSRIRFVWTRIWTFMSEHFINVICQSSHSTAIYALDSLRQLAMKFLEKDELSNYQFQRDFLKPFETVIDGSSQNAELREYVVRCVQQMIFARAKNIKSGWKIMFQVLSIAANDNQESIVRLAYECVEFVILGHFSLVSETFVECVNCLVFLGANPMSLSVGTKSVGFLGECIRFLTSGAVHGIPAARERYMYADDEDNLRVWFPVLTGLSRLVNDARSEVRHKAVTTLFNSLREFGEHFAPGFWSLLFSGVIMPLFDDVRTHDPEVEVKKDNDWLLTTFPETIRMFVDLFCVFFQDVRFLLKDVIGLIQSSILQVNQHVVSVGVTSMVQLVVQVGKDFTSSEWELFTKVYIDAVHECEPAILTWRPPVDDSSPFRFPNHESVAIRLAAHLGLVVSLSDVFQALGNGIPLSPLLDLAEALYNMHQRIHEFHDNMPIRLRLARAGFSQHLHTVSVVQTAVLNLHFRILHSMFSADSEDVEDADARRRSMESKYVGRMEECLKLFLNAQNVWSTRVTKEVDELGVSLHEIIALEPVVVRILQQVVRFSDADFRRCVTKWFLMLAQLVESKYIDVRKCVRYILERSVVLLSPVDD